MRSNWFRTVTGYEQAEAQNPAAGSPASASQAFPALFNRISDPQIPLTRHSFEGLEPGTSYVVRADQSKSQTESSADTFYPGVTSPDSAEEIVLKPGERREGIDIQRRDLKSYCVDGIVEGLSGRFEGIEVVRIGAFWEMPTIAPNLARTDASGETFLVCGLAPGRYNFLAQSLSNRDAAAGSIQVEGQDVHEFRLRPLAPILFTAETAWEEQPSELVPVKVNVPISGWGIGFTLLVNDLPVPGKSSISPNLWPGEYSIGRVKLMDGRGVYVKRITWNGEHLPHRVLQIGRETRNCHIRVVLSVDGASLAAHVVDKAGDPIANAYVAVIPSDVTAEGDMSERMLFGQADQNGIFAVDTVPPGRYNILATTDVIDMSANRIARLWKARTHSEELQFGVKAAVEIRLVPESHR